MKIRLISIIFSIFFFHKSFKSFLLSYFIVSSVLKLIIWFFGDTNPYKTYMFVGNKGCGKTSYIAKLALQFTKTHPLDPSSSSATVPRFYTNVEGIANTAHFDLDELESFRPVEGSVICADEIGLWVDARKFRTFSDGLNEFFKFARQYKCTIFLFSQAWSSDVDLKVRNLVDKVYVGKRIGKVSVWRPVLKRLGVVKRSDGTGNLDDTYVYSNILWFGCKFIYLPRYYGLFQSFNPPQRDFISYSLVKASRISEVYSNTLSWLIYLGKTFFSNKKEKLFNRFRARPARNGHDRNDHAIK